MSADDDRPYAVGKGKPPLSGRWAPGQSCAEQACLAYPPALREG